MTNDAGVASRRGGTGDDPNRGNNSVARRGAHARHRHVPAERSWPSRGVNLLRGALIGTVETVPGVSGGTVALVVGVYETIITSAGHFLSGLRRAVVDIPRRRGAARAGAEFREVRWDVIVPLLIGMAAALVIMARLLETWVEDYPLHTRALFFGLVLASLAVPFRLAGRWSWGDYGIGVAAAALAYVVVSLPPGDIEPSALVIMLAAAVAVSALVLPGLSGAFLLLTFGLYEDTLSAVNQRDLGYIGLFALGAVVGLASFVKLLQWLLEHRRHLTLVVLTGVMAGCLRALWPWQDEDRSLLAPDEHTGAALGLAALGFAAVAVFVLVERRFAARRSTDAH